MKRPLIHAPYKGVHPYFEILRFWDEKPPKDFHFFIQPYHFFIQPYNFFILTRTRYITGHAPLEYRYCLQPNPHKNISNHTTTAGDRKILFFICLLDSELFKGAAHTLMRQPLFYANLQCVHRTAAIIRLQNSRNHCNPLSFHGIIIMYLSAQAE